MRLCVGMATLGWCRAPLVSPDHSNSYRYDDDVEEEEEEEEDDEAGTFM